jgi:hypothetical protein
LRLPAARRQGGPVAGEEDKLHQPGGERLLHRLLDALAFGGRQALGQGAVGQGRARFRLSRRRAEAENDHRLARHRRGGGRR